MVFPASIRIFLLTEPNQMNNTCHLRARCFCPLLSVWVTHTHTQSCRRGPLRRISHQKRNVVEFTVQYLKLNLHKWWNVFFYNCTEALSYIKRKFNIMLQQINFYSINVDIFFIELLTFYCSATWLDSLSDDKMLLYR